MRPQLGIEAADFADLARNDDLLLPDDLRVPVRATVTVPRPYLRWEPVPAPALVPRKELGTGEQPAVLVVRTGTDGGEPPDTRASAERHLAAPKATQLEAEAAGKFDKAIGTGDARRSSGSTPSRSPSAAPCWTSSCPASPRPATPTSSPASRWPTGPAPTPPRRTAPPLPTSPRSGAVRSVRASTWCTTSTGCDCPTCPTRMRPGCRWCSTRPALRTSSRSRAPCRPCRCPTRAVAEPAAAPARARARRRAGRPRRGARRPRHRAARRAGAGGPRQHRRGRGTGQVRAVALPPGERRRPGRRVHHGRGRGLGGAAAGCRVRLDVVADAVDRRAAGARRAGAGATARAVGAEPVRASSRTLRRGPHRARRRARAQHRRAAGDRRLDRDGRRPGVRPAAGGVEVRRRRPLARSASGSAPGCCSSTTSSPPAPSPRRWAASASTSSCRPSRTPTTAG